MNIEFAQVQQMIQAFMLPLVRIGALLMTMTVFGSRTVSPRFRILLAVAIAFCVAPSLPTLPQMELFSAKMIFLVAEQLVIGIVFGFISRLFVETFVLGAQVIAMQTGLGFAAMVDPTNGLQVPVVSQFFLMMATLMFLAIDGHLLMIRMLINSFHTLPIGESGFNLVGVKAVLDWVAYLFAAALMMSLAAAFSLLMINLSFGVMTRAAPQLNIFAIGFPITMMGGLLIVWFTLSGFLNHFEAQFQRAYFLMCDFMLMECR